MIDVDYNSDLNSYYLYLGESVIPMKFEDLEYLEEKLRQFIQDKMLTNNPTYYPEDYG